MRYEFSRKEKLLSFGAYPDVSLAGARDRRDDAKRLLRQGRDPSLEKKLELGRQRDALAHNFEAVARVWFARTVPTWTERHANDVLTSLERDVFPQLGPLPITEITPPCWPCCEPLKPDQPSRPPGGCGSVCRRFSSTVSPAVSARRIPAAIVKGAMAPLIKGRQPAIVDLNEAREVMRLAEAEPAHPITKLALRLLARTAVRPGEIRGATWHEFEHLDGREPLWRIPPQRTKMKHEHLVPLSHQAVAAITAVRQLTGRGPLVFPNARHAHRPMSENAIGYLLNRAGYHNRHVPHGWRATFSTVMNERHQQDRQVIDLMLAHAPKDKTEAAYNRAAHMPRRRELAQAWADLLLADMPEPAAVLGGPRRG